MYFLIDTDIFADFFNGIEYAKKLIKELSEKGKILVSIFFWYNLYK